MSAQQPAQDAELHRLTHEVGQGDAGAALDLCRHLKPATLTAFVDQVPGVTPAVFDAIADGYAAWLELDRPGPL